MRIVSGDLRGRRFEPPVGFTARPTTDFAKENLFNVLANIIDFEEVKVLDLFSGSGSISYEFASRGCRSVVSVEQDFKNQKFISDTVRQFGLQGKVRSMKGDALKFLKATRDRYDVIFADPPFEMEDVDLLPDMVVEADVLSEDGFFILEHSGAGRFDESPYFWQTRHYGKVNFTFFRRKVEEEQG